VTTHDEKWAELVGDLMRERYRQRHAFRGKYPRGCAHKRRKAQAKTKHRRFRVCSRCGTRFASWLLLTCQSGSGRCAGNGAGRATRGG